MRRVVAPLVLVVAAAALLGLLLLGRLPDADDAAPLLAGLGSGLALAAGAYAVLHRRTRSAGRAGTVDELLRTLDDRAARGAPLEELLRQLCERLGPVLDLRGAEVWTGDGTTLTRQLAVPASDVPARSLDAEALRRLVPAGVVGEHWLRLWLPDLLEGREGCAVRAVPAVHGGEVLGLLLVTRSDLAPRFRDRDERALAEAGRRLGLLLHDRHLDAALRATLEDLRQANEELRASRARLVAASDAERRRIERDLHDGVQQHLVALAVTLGMAADLVHEDPDAARELVASTRDEARAAVGQLRDLAHGIYPPLLLESGLPAALQALPARTPGLSLDVEDVGRTAPEVEAALYFGCLEALANAGKHAAGSPVQLRLSRTPDALRAEVVDTGPGMPADPPRGSGRQNVLDRLGAVGGTARWLETPGGGTTVVLEAP